MKNKYKNQCFKSRMHVLLAFVKMQCSVCTYVFLNISVYFLFGDNSGACVFYASVFGLAHFLIYGGSF